ncbi:MAG: hypothetical protein KZQ89_02985 [Candidatus Thiodiazotropha sp. (ex Lucinoma kastoroae)]|nr:hypothetical protein [Candidatus Thiodiazotropha sp. (ex Lucinoma kastoroae)]
MRKKEPALLSNPLSEFILILRDTIKANLKLRHFLKKNKKDNFLFEDCFFTVDASLRDLHDTYKEAIEKNTTAQ